MADSAPGDSLRCCSADKFGGVAVGGQRTLFNGLECALVCRMDGPAQQG